MDAAASASSSSSSPSPSLFPSLSLHLGSDVEASLLSPHSEERRDEQLASSLSSLSSVASRRLPASSPLYAAFTAWDELWEELPVWWLRWQSLPVTVRLAAVFLCLFYLLLFSARWHLLLLCLYGFALCCFLSCRQFVQQRGLITLIPSPVLPLLTDYSLLELGHLVLSSRLTSDLLALFLFPLSDAEMRALMQRLPPAYRRAISRRGVIGLLPAQVVAMLFPQQETEPQLEPELLLEAGEERRAGRPAEVEDESEESRGAAAAAEQQSLYLRLPPIPPDVLERKYDSIDSEAREEEEEEVKEEQEVQQAIHAVVRIDRAPSSSLSSSSTQSSPVASACCPSPETPDEDAVVDAASLTLAALIDRQLSSSLSSVFRSWARQSYTALYDAAADLLPSALTSPSTLQFFLPLASTVTALHLLSSSQRARSIMRRSEPYLLDGAVWLAAVVACHHLYAQLVESFSRRREQRRLSGPERGERGSAAAAAGSRGDVLHLLRLYLRYVWHRTRQDRGVVVSAVVLLGWLLYLSKGRVRLLTWWERREVQRLAALTQLTNRLT